jgi:integrase
MAKMGVRLETIAKLFGHKSIQTTMRYVEPGWEDLEKAVEMI